MSDVVSCKKTREQEQEEIEMAEQFRRLLSSSGDVFSSVFSEQVLKRNKALEAENKMLRQAVWSGYGHDSLQEAVVFLNKRGFGYHCTCHYCSKNASPKLLPTEDRACKIRYFVKMAINRAGLHFTCKCDIPSIDVVESGVHSYPGKVSGIATHIVFEDINDVYTMIYGRRIWAAVDHPYILDFDKLKLLFRMLRDHTHYTYAPRA